MDENKLKTVIKEVVDEAVDPIKKQLSVIDKKLDDPDTGLAAINERLDSNTRAVMKLESTVNGYGDMYKINDSNIRKMEKRLETVEEKEGIGVPPELHLEPLSEAA